MNEPAAPARLALAAGRSWATAAMAGQEARAALALEPHIRVTPDLLRRATKEGRHWR